MGWVVVVVEGVVGWLHLKEDSVLGSGMLSVLSLRIQAVLPNWESQSRVVYEVAWKS